MNVRTRWARPPSSSHGRTSWWARRSAAAWSAICRPNGAYRRIRHVAYIVIGVLADYRHRGIGRACFEALDGWAADAGIRRLELTVQATNPAAIGLYRKAGFEIEGVRRDAMLVDGVLVDELYMAKILDGTHGQDAPATAASRTGGWGE